MVATDLLTAVQDAAMLAEARASLTATMARGSTIDARDAAEVWLL